MLPVSSELAWVTIVLVRRTDSDVQFDIKSGGTTPPRGSFVRVDGIDAVLDGIHFVMKNTKNSFMVAIPPALRAKGTPFGRFN